MGKRRKWLQFRLESTAEAIIKIEIIFVSILPCLLFLSCTREANNSKPLHSPGIANIKGVEEFLAVWWSFQIHRKEQYMYKMQF